MTPGLAQAQGSGLVWGWGGDLGAGEELWCRELSPAAGLGVWVLRWGSRWSWLGLHQALAGSWSSEPAGHPQTPCPTLQSYSIQGAQEPMLPAWGTLARAGVTEGTDDTDGQTHK